MRAKLIVIGMSSVITAGVALGYFIGGARASGIPTTQPLTYSGVLTDTSGVPLTGTKNIQIAIWDAAANGNQQCSIGPASQALSAGGFQVALPQACLTAVHGATELWVEVFVDGSSLGRSKLGATPYSVESDHAVSATSATNATHAATADGAQTTFSVPGKLTASGGLDETGNVSITGSPGMRAVTVGVTGCTPNNTYAGVSVQGPMTNCTEYSLLGNGADLLINRPTGNMIFRKGNADQMILDPTGHLKMMAGTNPINFTDAWTGSPDAVTNVSEISNDIGTYKTLMLVGNRSAGLGRRVSVWDRFEVNGTFVNNSTRDAKQDIHPLSEADYAHILDAVGKTDVFHYRFKAAGIDRKQRIGVIAEESPPEILDETGKAVSFLDYNGFLLATVKAQQVQIRDMKSELESLKREVRAAKR
jgi:hypothetical protein